jgi:hypothetical protein
MDFKLVLQLNLTTLKEKALGDHLLPFLTGLLFGIVDFGFYLF